MKREEYERLSAYLNCNDLNSCKNLIDIMIDGMFSIIRNCHPRGSKTEALADAKILMQMFFLKCISFRRLLDGTGYRQCIGKASYELSPIVDHPTLLSLVRSLYEAFCTFELLYILPDNEEKQSILNNLFIIHGLNERQGYYHSFGYEKQKENEKQQIEECAKEIRDTNLYKNLSAANRNTIENHIIHPHYRIIIDSNNSIRKFNWDDYDLLRIKKEAFEDVYSYLSLYSHPSFLSVLQFRDAFEIDNDNNTQFTCTATRYAIAIMSFYISDYCELFSEAKDIANQWDAETKFIIGFYNQCFRK